MPTTRVPKTPEAKRIAHLEMRNRILHKFLDAFERECAGRASDPLQKIVTEWRRLRNRIKKKEGGL